MLSLIGGAMLLCAVAAMLLLATWSLSRDEAPDAHQRDGILAFRSTGAAPKKTAAPGQRRRQPRTNRPAPQKPKLMTFDADEMAEIEEEAEANLPQFVRESREEY